MSAKSFHSPAGLGLLSTTTFGLVQFLVIALYPALSEAIQISIAQLILCFTLGSLFFVWSGPYWAKKSDTSGRQNILRIGLAGLSLSFFILVILTEISVSANIGLAILLLSRLIYGFTASAIVSVVQAWWRDQSGEVTKNMLSHSIGLNLGRFFAPLLILILQGQIRPLLWFVAIWSMVLMLASFWKNTENLHHTKTEEAQMISLSEMSSPLVIAFLSTVFIGIIHSNLAHHIKLSLSLSATETTLLCSRVLLVSSIIVLGMQLALKRFRNLKGLTLIWLGIPCWMITSYLFFGMQTQTQLWAAIIFLSIGLAGVTPGYLALLKSGGKAAGYVGSTQTIGLTIGGAIGYLILQNYIPYDLSLFVLCFLLMAACVRLRFMTGEVSC